MKFERSYCNARNLGSVLSEEIYYAPIFGGCVEKNDIVHILSCKKGGYVSIRHNSLRDTMANLMKDAGCSYVQKERPLLPVNPNDFRSRTNTTDGARLDISACTADYSQHLSALSLM